MANATGILADIIYQQPDCAQRCWDYISHMGLCNVHELIPFTDCLCTNIPLLASISTCMQQSCNWEDQAIQKHTQQALCASYPKESKKTELVTLAVVGMTLATVTVLLRCYSRIVAVRRLWWDDWTAVLSLALMLAMASVGVIGTNIGFGLHYWDTEPQATIKIRQIFYAVEIGYLLNITLLKVSIMLLFSRIFETPLWHRMTQAALIFFALKVIAFLFPLIFQCNPLEAAWNPSVDGQCLSVAAMGFAGAGFSITEDLIYLVLPIPTLWKLQLGKTKRIWLTVLFGIGSFACVTSIIRIKFLMTFALTNDLTSNESVRLGDNVEVTEWTGIELVSTLVCGSIPPCWSQIVRFGSYTWMNMSVLRHRLQGQHLAKSDSTDATRCITEQK